MARKTYDDLFTFALKGHIMISKPQAAAVIILVFQFILGLTLIIMGACLYAGVSTRSLAFLNLPFIVIGVILLANTWLGCAFRDTANDTANDSDEPSILCVSVCAYIVLYLGLLALAAFALAVSSKGGGHSLPGRSYKEYHLNDYSHWLRNRVVNWDSYKRHLVKNHVCSAFSGAFELDTLDEFHTEDLSPIEAGCCKSPDYCKFNYTSTTSWIKPKNHSFNSTSDCDIWDNDPKTPLLRRSN